MKRSTGVIITDPLTSDEILAAFDCTLTSAWSDAAINSAVASVWNALAGVV